MKPQLFGEVSQIAQPLVDHRSVVLNLKLMDPEQAQRAVDFIAGFTWTMKRASRANRLQYFSI